MYPKKSALLVKDWINIAADTLMKLKEQIKIGGWNPVMSKNNWNWSLIDIDLIKMCPPQP